MNRERNMLKDFDKEILCLFPSLDFTKPNVHAQKKNYVETLLTVLQKAAENDYVTKYMLTKWDASPRMGGQSAQNSLQELESIGLLRAKTSKSEKRTLRIDRILTGKGIIACMILPQFQKTNKLKTLLKKPILQDNELALSLKLYNETFVRGTNLNQNEISPAVIVIKQLAKNGFNLELKPEENIVAEIRRSEEKMFLESLKIDAFDFFWDFFLFLSEQDKNIRNFFFKELEKNIELFSALGPLSSEQKKELKKSSLFVKELVLLITSQEYFRFIKNSDAKVIEKMYEKVDENIKKNQIEFQNPSEGLIYSLKYLRKMLRADL